VRSNRHAIIAAAVLLAAIFGLVFHQIQTARVTRAALEGAARKQAILNAELRKRRISIGQMELEKTRLINALEAAKAALSRSSGDAEVRAQQEVRLKNLHAWLELRNGSFYRKLGLAPDQVDKFERLSIAHWMRMQDIVEGARDQGVSGSDSVVGLLQGQENAQFEKEEASLLGEEAYQQLREYDRTLEARTLVSGVAGNVYYTSSPLTAEQGDQLAQILAKNSASYQQGGDAGPNDINLATTLSQAAEFLSPTQIAALKNSLWASDGSAKLWTALKSLTDGAALPTQVAGK